MNQRSRVSCGIRAALAGAAVFAASFIVVSPGAYPANGSAAAASVARSTSTSPDTTWRDAVLYFVVLDRFADGDSTNNKQVDVTAKGAFHGGDLDGLTRHLDEIADLGVTALWITPVVQNIPGYVTGAGFADWAYHGYWADDFTKLDPRFGTEADLKALVDACHARGMRVLLDVVYNHVGYGSKYLTNPRTKTWLRTEATGTCGSDDLTQCLSGLPDLKTERKDVAEYLYKAHLGLAKRVGLDGFRLDTVKHVAHAFWKEHRARTRRELGPGFFLLGEVWGGNAESLDPWFEGDEMDAGFDFSFQGSVLGFLQGRGRTVAFDRYLQSRENVRQGYSLAHFLSSHDVPGALHQLKGDVETFRLAAVLQLTAPGIPVLYYGEEVARPGGDWPENRSDMPWGDRPIRPGAGRARNDSLRADYRRLIGLRRTHPALARGRHVTLSTEGDLLVFARRDTTSGDEVVVAVNRGAAAAEASVEAPAGWSNAGDRWGGTKVQLIDRRLRFTVPAKAACIVTGE